MALALERGVPSGLAAEAAPPQGQTAQPPQRPRQPPDPPGTKDQDPDGDEPQGPAEDQQLPRDPETLRRLGFDNPEALDRFIAQLKRLAPEYRIENGRVVGPDGRPLTARDQLGALRVGLLQRDLTQYLRDEYPGLGAGRVEAARLQQVRDLVFDNRAALGLDAAGARGLGNMLTNRGAPGSATTAASLLRRLEGGGALDSGSVAQLTPRGRTVQEVADAYNRMPPYTYGRRAGLPAAAGAPATLPPSRIQGTRGQPAPATLQSGLYWDRNNLMRREESGGAARSTRVGYGTNNGMIFYSGDYAIPASGLIPRRDAERMALYNARGDQVVRYSDLQFNPQFLTRRTVQDGGRPVVRQEYDLARASSQVAVRAQASPPTSEIRPVTALELRRQGAGPQRFVDVASGQTFRMLQQASGGTLAVVQREGTLGGLFDGSAVRPGPAGPPLPSRERQALDTAMRFLQLPADPKQRAFVMGVLENVARTETGRGILNRFSTLETRIRIGVEVQTGSMVVTRDGMQRFIGTRGYFESGGDPRIALNPLFMTSSFGSIDAAGTLAHELGHSVLRGEAARAGALPAFNRYINDEIYQRYVGALVTAELVQQNRDSDPQVARLLDRALDLARRGQAAYTDSLALLDGGYATSFTLEQMKDPKTILEQRLAALGDRRKEDTQERAELTMRDQVLRQLVDRRIVRADQVLDLRERTEAGLTSLRYSLGGRDAPAEGRGKIYETERVVSKTISSLNSQTVAAMRAAAGKPFFMAPRVGVEAQLGTMSGRLNALLSSIPRAPPPERPAAQLTWQQVEEIARRRGLLPSP